MRAAGPGDRRLEVEAAQCLAQIWKIITYPGAKALEMVIPDKLVRKCIEGASRGAEVLAGQEDIKRRAGVQDLAELRDRPLDECDRLAIPAGVMAMTLATIEGAATGAGGVWTTLLDVPLLFVLALRTIRKIGHCYGYPLDDRRAESVVLEILVVAMSSSLQIRRKRLQRLRDAEGAR